MPRRLRALLLSLLMLSPGPAWQTGAALAVAGFATEAFAQSRARSSGGYSRPSSGGYARRPSTSGPRVTPRTPSTSGGYGRSGGGSSQPYARRPSSEGSSWDRNQARGGSADALDRFRRSQEPVRPPSAQVPGGQVPSRQGQALPPPPVGGGAGDVPWWRRGGTLERGRIPGGGGYARGGAGNGGWYRDRGWSPGGIGGFSSLGQRGFGLWDGLFLWFMLNNLSRPGATDFFHNHRDDPGVREFRSDLERQAQSDPEIRGRLEELDRQLAQRQGQPRDPSYLPPDVPPEVALAPRGETRTPSAAPAEAEDGGGGGGGFGLSGILLLGGLGFGAVILLRRRRQAAAAPGLPGSGGAMGGPAPRRVPDIIGGGGGMQVRGGPGFRVGMVVTLDPTPFLLGAGQIKVPPPPAATAGGEPRLSVEAVGRVAGAGGAQLVRLHLPGGGAPGGGAMVELHLDGTGQIEVARYFATIDEVTPADEAEWGAWLDPHEGMIGWSEFQTKDGRTYARAWSPGQGQVPPRVLDEAVEGLEGVRRRRSQAMLYAAPTGAAAPAPETEYILVSAIEEGGSGAWVEIRAGIDINPASLSLP